MPQTDFLQRFFVYLKLFRIFAAQTYADILVQNVLGMKGGGALYIEEDVYLTFYLWHTETRNFKKWSHDNAAVDVHGCVVYSHHCIW